MRRVPGGRDGGDEAVAAVDDVLAARLPRRPAFPVLALVDPPVEPGFLLDAEFTDGVLDRVSLASGDVLGDRHLVVTTGPLQEHRRAAAEVCADALDAFVAGPWRTAAPAPEVPFEPVDVTVSVGGLPGGPAVASVRGMQEGDAWAAVLDLPRPGLRVVVTGRAVRPWVRLDAVADLGPWLAARRDALARVRAAAPDAVDPAELDLPPARGFEAHEALVELVRGVHAGIEERLRSGRRRAGLPADWAVVWERATRAQMFLATQGRQEATDAVTSLANHVTALDEEDVLGGDPVLRAAAVAECVRWTAFASQVPSEPAQVAWQERWIDRSPVADLRWRSAWADWTAARRPGG